MEHSIWRVHSWFQAQPIGQAWLRCILTHCISCLLTITQEISKRFGVTGNKLRVYVHYHPSYYHFHVHVTHVDWEGPGTSVGKAHLLSEIISRSTTQVQFLVMSLSV
jgi:hypothetical protein